MLVQFSVGNFLSFKEIVTLSMLAAKIKPQIEDNMFTVGRLQLLKSAVIYGSNASGKSNLVKAMAIMVQLMRNSSKESQVTESIPVEHYKLSTKSDEEPSFFEMVFIAEGIRYRYGFEVNQKKVLREWLYHVPNERESMLFERIDREFHIKGQFKEGRNLDEKTRDNALFLSVVAQFNGKISGRIMNWLNSFNIISGIEDVNYAGFTIDRLQNSNLKNKILDVIKAADLDIDDIYIEQVPINPEQFPAGTPDFIKQMILVQPNVKNTIIQTKHKKYNENNKIDSIETFNMSESESHGTQKIFALAGPIVDTLECGKVLVVDELDAKLHPHLTKFIMGLFNSELNRRNAQLIFNTHDVNLLDSKKLRRDQIWFTNKDRYGATDVYSLVEFQTRSDAQFRKEYMAGKYGATPVLNELEEVLWIEK